MSVRLGCSVTVGLLDRSTAGHEDFAPVTAARTPGADPTHHQQNHHGAYSNTVAAVQATSGPTASVLAFAQGVTAERGVRHGEFRSIPVDVTRPHQHTHQHLRAYT